MFGNGRDILLAAAFFYGSLNRLSINLTLRHTGMNRACQIFD